MAEALHKNYTTEEAQDFFPYEARTIRKKLRTGEIPGGFKVGRKWCISETAIKEFLTAGK